MSSKSIYKTEPSADRSESISADGLGNVYISGWTTGHLAGTNQGGFDAFVSKYNNTGTLLWTKQLGSASYEISNSVSADGLGNVYISGWTIGHLTGINQGDFDAFITKYDTSGTLLWTRQLGTAGREQSNGVSADGLGNVYISGWTSGDLAGTNAGGSDAFVTKYDTSGTLLWTRLLGTADNEQSNSVSADGLGNVYISGWTNGDLAGINPNHQTPFIAKYDTSGTLLWTRLLSMDGSGQSHGVSADGLGNVYISGWTTGDLARTNAGFVTKYDTSGTLLWTRLLGTANNGVSTDGLGNAYISGWIASSSLPRNYYVFISKLSDLAIGSSVLPGDYNGDGVVDAADFTVWRDNLGATDETSLHGNGNSVGGVEIGDFALWKAHFGETSATPVPEPSSLLLAGFGFATLLGLRRRIVF